MQSYYAVIPTRVLTDKRINANAKLVYGIIAASANAEGYSVIGNAAIAETLGLALRSVPRIISQLADLGLFGVQLLPSDGGNDMRRMLWLRDAIDCYMSATRGQTEPQTDAHFEGGHDTSVMGGHDTSVMGGHDNVSNLDIFEGGHDTSVMPPPQKQAQKKSVMNIYNINTTSTIKVERESTHQLAHQTKNKQNSLSLDDDAFVRFWETYPRKVDKGRALAEWRKLSPSPELVETIIQAVERQRRSTQWQEAEYIPHPRTWLHNRRWEAEETSAPPQRTAPPGLERW